MHIARPPGWVTWGAVVLPQVIQDKKLLGYIVVRDVYRSRIQRSKPQHVACTSDTVFKFPGGGRDTADQTPADTASRECQEESGVGVHTLTLRGRTAFGLENYKYFFTGLTDSTEVAWLYNPERNSSIQAPRGNDGEFGYHFTPTEFATLIRSGGLLQNHLNLLRDANVLEHVLRGELLV